MFELDFTRSYYCYVCHPKDDSVCLSLNLRCFSFISLKTKFHASMQLNYVPFRFISLKTFLRLFATELSCFKLYQGQKRFSALFVLSPYLTFKGNWCRRRTYLRLAPNDCTQIADSGSYVNSRQNEWC